MKKQFHEIAQELFDDTTAIASTWIASKSLEPFKAIANYKGFPDPCKYLTAK
jgi:hypothetical protein